MKISAFIVCSIVFFARDVASFEFIRDIFFPRVPEVNRIRRIGANRTLEDDYAVLDSVGLIEQHGYPAEQHNVTTDDGYNIVFFRIPGSPLSPANKRKCVVFMQHGITGSSDSWVLFGPKHDIAFLLADRGCDVWLGNTRGNTYSRSHNVLSPLNKKFWDFSYHEMSTLDLPKMIDYALEYTEQKTLIYIGHSMGTTMSYVLLSERPEYNERMRLVVSLAPIAFWKQKLHGVYQLFVDNGDLIKKFLALAEIYEIAPQTKNNIRLSRAFCSDNSTTQSLCIMAASMLAGEDPAELNATLLPYIVSYYPAGTSVKTLEHLQKNMNSGIMEKYDYGNDGNIRIYGEKKAPIYDLKKISAPVALIYGKRDALSLETNVAELAKRLPNVVIYEALPYDNFNHLDFLWATNAKELLYNRLIEIIDEYTE